MSIECQHLPASACHCCNEPIKIICWTSDLQLSKLSLSISISQVCSLSHKTWSWVGHLRSECTYNVLPPTPLPSPIPSLYSVEQATSQSCCWSHSSCSSKSSSAELVCLLWLEAIFGLHGCDFYCLWAECVQKHSLWKSEGDQQACTCSGQSIPHCFSHNSVENQDSWHFLW